MLFLDMEPNWFLTGLRTFLASISAIIYELIGDMYSFFLTLGRIDLLSSDTISGIYTRVSMLLGLFMLFKLLFSFLQMMINPDLITDKQKGVGNIIIRILVVVVMLGSTPAIFQAAFRFQGLILDEGVIEKLVLSKESNSNTANAMGNELSWTLFNQFYHLEGDLDCSKDTGLELLQMEAELYGSYNLIYNCIDETENTNYGLGDQNSDIYVVHWDGWTAIAVGIFVLWILLMYCISVGVRVIQLAFLQLIAPIPIISYLMPGKNDSFQKWGKQCLTTYLDLFIRIALISFIFVMIGLVFNDETIRSLKDTNGLNWVMIFLVLGLLLFAKKAPELLKELFPSSGAASGNFGIGMKGRETFGKAAAGAIGLGVGGAVGFLGGVANGKGVKGKIGGAIKGVAGGSVRGVHAGYKSNGSLSGVWGAGKTTMTNQAKANSKIGLSSTGALGYIQNAFGYNKAEQYKAEAEAYDAVKGYIDDDSNVKNAQAAFEAMREKEVQQLGRALTSAETDDIKERSGLKAARNAAFNKFLKEKPGTSVAGIATKKLVENYGSFEDDDPNNVDPQKRTYNIDKFDERRKKAKSQYEKTKATEKK